MQRVNAAQGVKEMLTHTIETLDVAWMSSRPVAECLRHARSMRHAARDAAVTFTVTREDCEAAGVSAALWLGSMGRARQCGALERLAWLKANTVVGALPLNLDGEARVAA